MNGFYMTESQVDSLIADFRQAREEADQAGNSASAAIWHLALAKLQRSQLDAFHARSRRRRTKPLRESVKVPL